jgi:hypothetical protein
MQIISRKQKDLQLAREGFAILPTVDEHVLTELRAYYQTLDSPIREGFHPTMFWSNPEIKRAASDKISSALETWINTHIPGYRALYGNFMVKEPGASSRMKLHQDWSYVDETTLKSFAIWIPLQDLNEQNGALWVVPQSHMFQNHFRGPGVFAPFEEYEALILKNYAQPLYLKAGQVVIWEHHVLHYSPANFSESPRIAATVILVPENVEIFHYFKDEGSDITSEYIVDESFFTRYTVGEHPKLHLSERRSFQDSSRRYSAKEIKCVLSKSWWQSIYLKVKQLRKF